MNMRLRTCVGALLACAVVLPGCATSIAHMQTGKVVKKGDIELGVGASIPISQTLLERLFALGDKAFEKATAADTKGVALTEDEHRELIEAGLAIVLFSPAPVTELWGRYGLGTRFDIGAKTGGSRYVLDVRYQLMHAETSGFDAALSLGGAHHSDLGPSLLKPLFDVFKKLKIAEYGREDVFANVTISSEGDYLGWYGAAGYTFAMTSVKTDLISSKTLAAATGTTFDNPMHVTSGVLGVTVKLKMMWLRAEFAMAYVSLNPTILGQKLNLSTLQYSPGLALGARF